MPDGPGFEWYRELAAEAAQPRFTTRVRPVTAQPRNGLPESRLYVYGGTGEDVPLGSYGDPALDGPGPVIVRGTAPARKDAICERD